MAGAWITFIGAVITLVVNYLFIPYYSYMACAWATFICYGSMMVISYVWGQKEYRIPYAWKKLLAYIVISCLLYGVHQVFRYYSPSVMMNHVFGVVLILAFMFFVARVEKKEVNNIMLSLKRK